MEFFSDSPLDDLIAEFPDWLRADDPTAELYKWLNALAQAHADLDATAEQVYADTALATASGGGLRDEWAYLFDLRPELAAGNLSADQMRAYIAAWIACNGSVQGLLNLLLAILRLDPRNFEWGPLTTFASDGSGLTFGADGSGIGPLFQFSTQPDPAGGLAFPLDGSGLTFPEDALFFPEDGSGLTLAELHDAALFFAQDGTGLALPASFPATVPAPLFFPNFSSLTFPSGAAWVTVTENFPAYGLTVTIKTWLNFDRGAVRRALDRYRQAHATPTVYTESNS